VADERRPILSRRGESPAAASDPGNELDGRWHVYEPNPVPWWVALLWLGFFAFAIAYLIRNLMS
jgi:hypothetical protein